MGREEEGGEGIRIRRSSPIYHSHTRGTTAGATLENRTLQ